MKNIKLFRSHFSEKESIHLIWEEIRNLRRELTEGHTIGELHYDPQSTKIKCFDGSDWVNIKPVASEVPKGIILDDLNQPDDGFLLEFKRKFEQVLSNPLQKVNHLYNYQEPQIKTTDDGD